MFLNPRDGSGELPLSYARRSEVNYRVVRCSPIYKPLYSLPPAVRYIHLWGGRSRGGSFAATDYALFYLSQPGYFRGYLMRYIQGDIRVSLWRDIMDRIDEKEDMGLLNRKDYKINTNEMSIVHLPTGNTLQSRGFKKSSGAQTAKMKSIAGATHIFLEEAEEVSKDDFNQLDDSLRTVKTDLRVFLIFNPPKKNHWIIKDYYTLTESRISGYYIAHAKVNANFLSIFSTYHDNIKYVAKSTIEKFEGYRVSDPDWYWTVVRGLISEGAKGRIYKGWKATTTAEFNSLSYSPYYVLDFGFSNDPLSLTEVKRHNKRRYVKELIYETSISDDELVRRLKAYKVGSRPIVADSAEPKSISFLRGKGFNVIAARKGADSVRFGIKAMQGLEFFYTQDSTNIAHEYQEYRWQLDNDKEPTNEPEDKNNHAMDGLRYGELTDPWGGGPIDHT